MVASMLRYRRPMATTIVVCAGWWCWCFMLDFLVVEPQTNHASKTYDIKVKRHLFRNFPYRRDENYKAKSNSINHTHLVSSVEQQTTPLSSQRFIQSLPSLDEFMTGIYVDGGPGRYRLRCQTPPRKQYKDYKQYCWWQKSGVKTSWGW